MATAHSKREIYVYADWRQIEAPILMGRLSAELVRGKEIFSFDYDQNWLNTNQAQLLDPDLQFYAGKQFLNDGNRANFGLFLDSSPDRWGRVLMRRREAAQARIEERKENALLETDYLLGVYDGHRMGGLRFKLDTVGPFLSVNRTLASPPWTSIRTLEKISLRLEEDDVLNDPEYLNWLNMLVAPGSSLGGARPKASVLDPAGHLWIAKFPSKNDSDDVGGWEKVVHTLAQRADINVANAKAQKFSSKYHTFLTQRFDRNPDGSRIHFASAMTLLGHNDGESFQDGISYLELAEFIATHGADVKADLKELWKRIVFSICVSNVDDHLRNHGFILTDLGWRLSPAYDINPVETATGLKLNITENENALDLGLALEVASYFRLRKNDAKALLNEIVDVVLNWRNEAKNAGISNQEIERKTRAFQNAIPVER
jgi:serine/threonine-protein kinase HipA